MQKCYKNNIKLTEMEKVNVPWTWQGSTEFLPPDKAIGFIYLVQCYGFVPGEDVKEYVGRKLLTTTNRKRIGVREKKSTKTRKTYKVVKKDSGWSSYNTSCKPLKELLDTCEHPWRWRKIVLEWAYSKKQLSWLETKHIVIRGLMEKDSWNENLLGKWFKKDTMGPTEVNK